MIMTLLALLIILFTGVAYWFFAFGMTHLAEKYAKHSLELRLFPLGVAQREKILLSMSHITKDKYPQDLLLDYFLKIKGLQVVNLFDPVNFWTRKYLMSPTKLKLNYFEQVRFYETFLNYPELIHKTMQPKNTPDNYFEGNVVGRLA